MVVLGILIGNMDINNMIWKTYKYVYYWLYTWQKKLWGENELPEYNVIFGMCLSLTCAILFLNVIFYLITDILLIPEGIPKVKVLLVLIIITIIHYFLFVHKGKYKQIEKEFKQESQAERKRKGFWVLLYTFGSMAFYVFLLFLGIWLGNNGYTPLIKYFL